MNPQDPDEKKSDFIETKYLESNNSEDVLTTRFIENITPQDIPQVVPKPMGAHLLLNRFLVLKVLGEGAFGKVFLAKDEQLGRLVAVKVFKRPVQDKKQFEESKLQFENH